MPDCLFADPKPPNLLTVPACPGCNNEEKSRDDTFLRDQLVVDIDNEHPLAKHLRETKMRRAVHRKQSELAELIAKAKIESRYDHEGKYLGEAAKVHVPDNRVTRILCRIVRGLYCCERKEILPKDHALTALRQPTQLFPELYEKLGRPKVHTFGDVFGYTWVHTEDPLAMIWLLWFYESVVFSVQSQLVETSPRHD